MSVQIIMPNRNYGKYIGEAIESVISQTYTDWELYVMDGMSTDDSFSIAKKYSHKNIICVQSEENMEQRINSAAKMSKGDFIVLLASDDKLLPTYLEENVKVFQKDSYVDFVYNSYVEHRGNEKCPHPHWEYAPDLLMKSFYMGVFWMVRRELWECVGGLYEGNADPENPTVFDYDFCLRCEEAGAKFHYLDKSLGWYRIHGESDTGRHSPQWLWNVGENARVAARERRNV